jgi:hypothetical protein
MFSFWRRTPAEPAAVDTTIFRQAMNRPPVARELFLPLDRASWDGGRYTLGRWGGVMRRPTLHGVRLQEPRPAVNGTLPERDTQGDLSALVGSVAELRREPPLAGVVLSEETLVGRQKGSVTGKRAVFGLQCPPDGRFQGETEAAAECHRVLQRALRNAGFAVDFPKDAFDPNSGFGGLRDWAANVRLRRRRSRRGLVLALVFLFLMIGLPVLLAYMPIPGTPPISSVVPSNSAPAGSPSAAPTKPGNAADANNLLKSLAAKGNQPNPSTLPKSPGGKGSESDLDSAVKQLEQLQKALGGSASNGSLLPGADGGLDDRSTRLGNFMAYAGTAAYIVGGAWLLWAAPDAGIGALVGLLLLPGYAFIVARSSWSKTWLPLVIHMGGMALVMWGVWLIFVPYYRMMQGLLG